MPFAEKCPQCGATFAAARVAGNARLCPECGIDLANAQDPDRTADAHNDAPIQSQALANDSYVPFAAPLSGIGPAGGSPPPPLSVPPPAQQTAATVPGYSPPAPADEAHQTRVINQAATAGGVPIAERPTINEDPRPAPSQNVPPASPGKGDDHLLGKAINGYVIKKRLGAGGMGAVYLARQISLDRDVALKILPANLAQNPDFLARFTREALSSAQLSHHNVMQVFDVGSDGLIHYIALELINGANLGDMTRKDGKMPFEEAVGYVLQAARGLSYAHKRGIIHRDIKPDNLMVNEHGVVKVADMGLAKIQGRDDDGRGIGVDYGNPEDLKQLAYGDLTGINVAMGTPAYMAPEQGRDAGKADHRADQYSLGCTLYYMVAGKTPFSGKTSFEIISKHISEPLVPLETHVQNVPKELTLIIERMLRKIPDERYPSMEHCVEALEGYLGIDSLKGPYTPKEHHVATLETEQKAYYAAPTGKLRKLAPLAIAAIAVLMVLVAAVMREGFLAGAAIGFLILTPLFSFVINGVQTKNYLFRRVRSVFFGMDLKGWALMSMWTILALAVLYIFGLLMPWIVIAVVAGGVAAAYQFLIIGKLRAERHKPIRNTQDMLKLLRIKGIPEEGLQDFVCRYGGEQWEEFFEELFGYEDMVLQRARWATREKVRPRKKYATWRDPLARGLDEVEEKRRKRHEERTLAKAEKARLKAGGMDEAAADAEADKLAKQAVEEGLLQQTVVLAGVPIAVASKAEVEKASMELYKSGKSSGGPIVWGFRLARLAVALVLIGGVAAPYSWSSVPPFLQNLLTNYLYGAGFANSLYGGAAGILLLISVFSSRFVLPLLMLGGGVVLVAGSLLIPLIGQPQFNDITAPIGGAGLVVVAFAALVFGKLGGGKF